jgi:sulfide:quinone oxidoreductase
MGPQALSKLSTFFNKLGIHKRFGKKIKNFTKDGVEFEDNSKLETDFTMFIPAGTGHKVIVNSDLPQNAAGFIKIDDFSNVANEDGSMSNIYAIGDITALEWYDWRAKQGHIAEIMAKNIAYNIEQRDNGGSNFKGYKKHLNILCVMDSGNGATFIYRDEKRAFMLPLPMIGHWLKKGWGSYCRYSKLGKIPRLPGM